MSEKPEFEELLFKYIEFYEQEQKEIVKEDKERLENSPDIISDFIEMFNESMSLRQDSRFFWLIIRYGAPNNFKLLLEWLTHELATNKSVEKQDNLGQSQENIIRFLIEKGVLQTQDIQKMITVLKRREISGYPDRPRKLLEFHLHEIEKVDRLDTENISYIENKIRFSAKHYVLAFIFDSYATGKILPNGQKQKLEQIGNSRIGIGKGNRFYKAFNEIITKDLNSKTNLKNIGGDDWRNAVIRLSKVPDLVEKYLIKKGL
ncbi:hypothetical protein [Cyclobacterium sp. SYSU L10401]|uniref:hypothetical protein n=1 Tax=Cyclobacterium sp. SYSU L10401 TaxID=2678657 RepID=UPI0013D2109E|nr:hypothetical protein [Cyclobacterium sp. SYSU L10401]